MQEKNNLNCKGVYAIRNLINGKMYIGSTSVSFRKRWQTHKKRLRAKQHHSTHLQNAWNKYGEENFVFQIIEIVNSSNCLQREGYYISFYKSCNPNFGYNQAEVNLDGTKKHSEATKAKLSVICKQQWENGIHKRGFNKNTPVWNKGIKCPNISYTRRNMFNAIAVYKDNSLIATFRSATDLEEWSKNNELPGMEYYRDQQNRPNLGRRTTHILASNIHRAIRNNIKYRGFIFKKTLPLSPEMGIVQWENCWKGEIPNQQPSQPLTKLEGSETNS